MNKKLIFTAIIFTLATIAVRLLPHVPNVAPVAALALFAGAYLPKKWSLVLPIAAMLISDVFVGFYQWQVMVAVYLGFALTVLIGWYIKSHGRKAFSIGAGAITGSIIFFLLTNAAVWQFTQMYSHTLSGLIDSYTMAIPFFKYSLLGDLAWTAVFFGAYQYALGRFPQLAFDKPRETALN